MICEIVFRSLSLFLFLSSFIVLTLLCDLLTQCLHAARGEETAKVAKERGEDEDISLLSFRFVLYIVFSTFFQSLSGLVLTQIHLQHP